MKQTLRYWHPALLAKELNGKPRRISLCGHEIVLFRNAEGEVSALADRCPHRQMRLSRGKVREGCIVCPFHGYRYDGLGQGQRPGSPNETIYAQSYVTIEDSGVIWLKERSHSHHLPKLADPSFTLIGVKEFRIKAPFQLLLDNMSELEHTPTVHGVFGFAMEDMHLVETSMATSDKSIDIFYQGPYRKVPFFLNWATGVGSSDWFMQTAEMHFEPVHAVYGLGWRNPATNQLRDLKLQFVIYYNPNTDHESSMFVFTYWNRRGAGFLGFNHLVAWFLEKVINRELYADIRLIESLPPGTENLAGTQLGRFDRPLLETRKYIDKLYYGNAGETSPKTQA